MASTSSKKREAGKLRERCFTLDEKIKILDKVKKSKMSSREIAEHFKIGKTQAANVVKNEITLRAEYENFRGKGFKHLKRENHQKYKVSIQFCTNGLKNVKLPEFILVVHYSKKKR